MAAPIDLSAAKKNLQEVLGDDMKSYLHNLKSWFRQKISKEEFDMEARQLLKSETVHFHNEFLLAIISKCQTLSSSFVPRSPPAISSHSGSRQIKRVKPKRRTQASRSSFQQRFVPVNPMTCAVTATYKGAEETEFVSRENSLPDISMVHGRLLVCAWETGLTTVDDGAVNLVMHAVETQLKNIIGQVLQRRNGYKVREKCFKFDLGAQIANPYTRHRHLIHDRTVESEATTISDNGHVPNRRLPQDCNEGNLAQELSMSTVQPPCRGDVTLYNLLETLQTYKNTIPSHSVYAPAVERIIHKLWHPGHEELDCNHREVSVKQKHAGVHQQPMR